MKDRESKRWLLGEFVKENEIRSVELEMAYKRFINLAPSSGGAQATQSFELDFNTWVSVSRQFVIGALQASGVLVSSSAACVQSFGRKKEVCMKATLHSSHVHPLVSSWRVFPPWQKLHGDKASVCCPCVHLDPCDGSASTT